MGKKESMEFLREISSLTIKELCEEMQIDRANLMSGRVSEEKTILIAETLKNKIKSIIDNYEKK